MVFGVVKEDDKKRDHSTPPLREPTSKANPELQRSLVVVLNVEIGVIRGNQLSYWEDGGRCGPEMSSL